MWLRETARYLNTHSPPPRQRISLIQFRSFDVRILVVSQYFWPENFRINDLVAGLVEKGHEVTVLTGHPNYPAGRFFPGHGWFRRTRERYHGAEVIRVPLVPRGAGGGIHLTLNYISFSAFGCLFGPLPTRGVVGAAAGSLFVFTWIYRAVLINYPSPQQKNELIQASFLDRGVA